MPAGPPAFRGRVAGVREPGTEVPGCIPTPLARLAVPRLRVGLLSSSLAGALGYRERAATPAGVGERIFCDS